MKNNFSVFLFVLLIATSFFQGCSKEDDYAGNPMGTLRFSADTLSFDTVFSGIATTTAWLKIYNTGNRKIRISGISLRSGGESGYRINVDGVPGVAFTDVDIPAGDSLYLFVELTAPHQGDVKPVLVGDAVLFQAEGRQKQIVLQAFSQDVTVWHGKIISSDTTLNAGKPFLIYDSLVVADKVKLSLSEGVTFYFHDKARMVVCGTLKAVGTTISPVIFRGDRLDDVLPCLPYDFYPGQWEGLFFNASSYDNEFDHVVIRGAYTGIKADSSSLDKSKINITNSLIHNMINTCIESNHCNMTIINSQLTNSGSNTVNLNGGKYDFIHCTIANYQRLIACQGLALALSNTSHTAFQAGFFNTILYGNHTSEIRMDSYEQSVWNIQFRNCLLQSQKLTSDFASGCIYSLDPFFLKLGDPKDGYRFDFRIGALSEACNRADPQYSKVVPYDLNGVSRLSDTAPDIGAYEYVSGQK